VRNQGGTAASAFVVTFHLSADTVYGGADDVAFAGTRSISSLAPGATNTSSKNLTVPTSTPPGVYYLCAMADGGAAVSEGDETNNTLCAATPLTVTAPDLVVTDATTTATVVVRGATFSLSNTVTNQGPTGAKAFVIGFALSLDAAYSADDLAFTTTRSLSSLAAGASSTSSTQLTMPTSAAPGFYYVCVVADRAGAVTESDEANNSGCTATTIEVR
jgi:subtilase family serine protease